MREDPLVKGQIYHIFSRSIAKYIIYNDDDDYNRFREIIDLYRYRDFNYKYSIYQRLEEVNRDRILKSLRETHPDIEIISYCIMPTHFHMVVKQVGDIDLTHYLAKILNSYTRYFNIRHNRKGPLWEGHFKSVLVLKDEQLLHLTRYIHLNPVSIGIVGSPKDWLYSSYLEYVTETNLNINICNFADLFDIKPKIYEKFVLDRADYQRRLSSIKSVIIENYSG